MTEPTRRSTYRQIETACHMLRRLHLTLDKDTSDLAIDVHPDVFKTILVEAPVDHDISKATTRWNEMRICGVLIRERAPGSQAEEDHMLKRGFRKAWVAGEVK